MKIKFKIFNAIFFNLIIFCSFFGMVKNSEAATYYVKNGGNDSFSGLDDANAWATIAKVSSSATSGDTVYFRSQDTWTGAATVLTAVSGVTYIGNEYGSGAKATLRATSSSADNMAVVKINVSNVVFRGFDVDGNDQILCIFAIGQGAPVSFGNIVVDSCDVHNSLVPTGHWAYGFYVGGISANDVVVSDVLITDTKVYSTGHEGFALYNSWNRTGCRINRITVRNCEVYDVGRGDGITYASGFDQGFYIMNRSDNITIEYSNIHDNGTGIIVGTSNYDTSESVSNLIVRYNMIYNNRFGLSYRTGDAGLEGSTGAYYGNLFFDTGVGWSGSGACHDIDIPNGDYSGSVFSYYNNTIYSTNNPCVYKQPVVACEYTSCDIAGTPIPVFNFKNNAIYTSNWEGIAECRGSDDFTCPGNFLTHSNNLIFRSSGSSDNHVTTFASTVNYNRSGVLTWEPTAQTTDPAFTGGTLPTGFTGTYGTDMLPNTDYFKITTGNALDTGATLGSPYNSSINSAGLETSFLRPVGTYDIGAYEYQGTEITPPASPSGLSVE
ncbi:MAG: hypothetical protein WC848_00570 [Parcubacteria group bacterium]|jgi:hypothetical protein